MTLMQSYTSCLNFEIVQNLKATYLILFLWS